MGGCIYSSNLSVLNSMYPDQKIDKKLAVFHFNDSKFLIVNQYDEIISQINEIIKSDPKCWILHAEFLKCSYIYFLKVSEKINKTFENPENLEKSNIFADDENSEINLNDVTIEQNPINDEKKISDNLFENLKKKFIIEIQRAKFFGDVENKNSKLLNPFVEISLKNIETSQKYKLQNSTKTSNSKEFPVWNEAFLFEFEDLGNALKNAYFQLSLFYYNEASKSKIKVGDSVKFSFSELSDQLLFEKSINIKDSKNESMFAQILIRCQYVYNFKKLLLYWKNLIEVKLEIIKRVLKKIVIFENINPNDKKPNLMENSFASLDNSIAIDQQSLYDNPYFIN